MYRDHSQWLTKLRWKAENNEFLGMKELRLDCFSFTFSKDGLLKEQQIKLLDFMGDSDHLNSLTVLDFCNLFLKESIAFNLKFTYSKKRSLKYNYKCLKCVIVIRKDIKKLIKETKKEIKELKDQIYHRYCNNYNHWMEKISQPMSDDLDQEQFETFGHYANEELMKLLLEEVEGSKSI